ncbi:transglutaminase family protein [Nocardia uniformis]|uniref:Transglutaminase family protein n=1 Tax=Nocardia uniformis TaxID=53432 RepID=A0A849C3R3_9NOCA|nr:transglutaminase family protein [Nocardia uniformis]NNH72236.1 transglutaminase family protein [Nocardia uniformis]
MRREVSARIDIAVHADTALVFQIAAARQPGIDLDESLRFELDGRGILARELSARHGGRIHVLNCPAGKLRAGYRATVTGAAEPEPISDYDLALYLRPSRYAESDRLLAYAAAEFGLGIGDSTTANRVSAWVGRRIRYVTGSSGPSDGAVETLLSGAGVCRDFSHLVVALLRAVGVPARVAAVYAPGCVPMDFHSVAEAYIDGAWRVFDPTGLAPRPSLVRIATGRDATDIAFLDNHGGDITLRGLRVTALVDGALPRDDRTGLVSIG